MRHLWIFIVGLSLTACSTFHDSPEKTREAVCNELTHDIIFNAATPDQNSATLDRANLDTINKSYRAEGCE